ncbi:MAG: SPOR domain-containing protein [Cyclobacteriaceae bacterium]
MDENKSSRPITPSPSIKRTPTIKRGPVPPKADSNESPKSIPSTRPVANTLNKGGKAGASAIKPAFPSGSISDDSKGGKKKFIIIGIAVAVVLGLIGLLVAPINNGKSILSGLGGSGVKAIEEGATDEIVGDEILDDISLLGDGSEISLDGDVSLEGGAASTSTDEGEVSLADEDNTANDVAITSNNVTTPSGPLEIDNGMLTSRTGRYYVIVGSFAIKDNAYRLKRKLGGNAKIIAPYGGSNLYKVSADDYSSVDQANTTLDQNMESYGVDVWIMKF